VEELHFTRHKFLLVTVKEWLESVLNYRSYPKNKTGYPFLDHPVVARDVRNVRVDRKRLRDRSIETEVSQTADLRQRH